MNNTHDVQAATDALAELVRHYDIDMGAPNGFMERVASLFELVAANQPEATNEPWRPAASNPERLA